MKYSIFLLLSCLLITSAFAGSTSTSTTSSTTTTPSATGSETTLNQTLLDNAAKAQQILNSQTTTAAPTSIKILSNKGSSATTTSADNLTDQEKQLSENYVHQGLANRIIQEKCTGDMKQACAGNEVDHKVMGMSPALMKPAAQAYATMGAMTDFMPLSKGKSGDAKTDSSGAQNQTQGQGQTTSQTPAQSGDKAAQSGDKAQKDKAADYCKYIPAATEGIAVFAQKNTTDSLSTDGDTSQKDTLLKAAKSHDSRAKQAQIQAAGWYGGAACYAVGAAMGSFAVDTSLVVKMGAATLLGTFYQEEVGANKEYAQKTRDIANQLPGKGYCNPVTQNDCYCSQPETENDPTYCKAQIAAKQAAASTFNRIACTNDKMQIDTTCECNKTNTCFDKFIENQSGGSLQLGFGTTGASPFKAIASLAHGKLENGTLSAESYAGTSAIAKKALAELGNKVPAGELNPGQKSVADAITSKGIPANVARLMASNSPSSSAVNSAMAKLEGLGSGPGATLAAVSSGRNGSVVDFSGGDGLGISGKKAGEKKSGIEDFMAKTNPKDKAVSNGKLIEFAQKAEKQASQITKTDDRSVFEIISSRYQTSGRKLLQIDSSN